MRPDRHVSLDLPRVERFARFGSAARDVGDALRFFTRLPAPGSGESAPLDFNRIAWAAPVAGVIVGLIGAGALGLTRLFGLPPLLCAGLATSAMVAATGALPEDGLFGSRGRNSAAGRPASANSRSCATAASVPMARSRWRWC